jgi:hypothetical protein
MVSFRRFSTTSGPKFNSWLTHHFFCLFFGHNRSFLLNLAADGLMASGDVAVMISSDE